MLSSGEARGHPVWQGPGLSGPARRPDDADGCRGTIAGDWCRRRVGAGAPRGQIPSRCSDRPEVLGERSGREVRTVLPTGVRVLNRGSDLGSRRSLQRLDLPQPPVQLVSTRENAAHQLLRLIPRALAGLGIAVGPRVRSRHSLGSSRKLDDFSSIEFLGSLIQDFPPVPVLRLTDGRIERFLEEVIQVRAASPHADPHDVPAHQVPQDRGRHAPIRGV